MKAKVIAVPGSILLFLLAVLLATTTGIDRQPYFTADYYHTTRAKLDSLLREQPLAHGRLEAGFGRATLVPPWMATGVSEQPVGKIALPLAGYGDREGRPAQGIADSVFVKSVVLRVDTVAVALVSMETLIVPPEVAETVRKEVESLPGAGGLQVLFGATHTHCGLGGWGKGWLAERFAGAYRSRVRAWLIAQTLTAIRQALGDVASSHFGYVEFPAPEFIENRLIGEKGRLDERFRVLLFEQKDGDKAVLGFYSAHATVLPASFMELSGDYPGYWMREIERLLPSAMALFFAGAVGSHGPPDSLRTPDDARRMGMQLAERTLISLRQITPAETTHMAALRLPVALPDLHLRISDALRLRPYLARHILPADATYLQGLRLGRLVWLAAPCDYSGELALDLYNEARTAEGHAIVTSFNGSYIGYVTPGRYYHLDAYETRTMSWFGPYMGDYLTELARRLMRGLLDMQ